MKAVVSISALIMLGACTTTQGIVSCDNAPKLREYAATTLRVLDQLCPVIIPDDEVTAPDVE